MPASNETTDAPSAAAPSARRTFAQNADLWSTRIKSYWTLIKPEITFLVMISALAGYVLGTPHAAALDGGRLTITLLGVALCSGGVGALNHYLERHLDAQMKRTRRRALPTGRVSPKAAKWYGMGLAAAGVGLLCPLVNPLTAILAGLSCLLYLFVYTPLKQKTAYNTLIGTIPGALPALGGWTAATGNLHWGGWTIFLTLAVWQMPHFLALAWMYRKDYGRAGFQMLPVIEPDGASTARQTLFFTALLLPISLTPVLAGLMSWIYLIGVIPLGLWFLYTAWRFYRHRTNQRARVVLKASIWYVPVLAGLILADWLVY